MNSKIPLQLTSISGILISFCIVVACNRKIVSAATTMSNSYGGVRFNRSCVLQATVEECKLVRDFCLDCDCGMAQSLAIVCDGLMVPANFWSKVAKNYLNMLFLCLATVANTLILMTLVQRSLREAIVFVYLRIVSLVALVLIVLQISGTIMSKKVELFKNNRAALLFIYSSNSIADAMKLLLSTFSTVLCFDRIVGIFVPAKYGKINNLKFVSIAFLVSALIACLTISVAPTITITYNPVSNGTLVTTNYPTSRHAMNHFIFAVRILEAGLMIGFTTAIVSRLKIRGRHLHKIMGGEAAYREEKKMANLCKFQIAETLVALLDLILLTLHEMIQLLKLDLGINTTETTYADYLRYFPLEVLLQAFGIVQMFAFQFSQFLLLFLYLLFSKLFRDGFRKMVCFFCNRHKTAAVVQVN